MVVTLIQTYLVAISYSVLHNVERIDHICGNWPQTCKDDLSFFFSAANLSVLIYVFGRMI